MSTTTRFHTHEKLMTKLADANGADMDLKLQTGEMTPDMYDEAVHNCTGCSDAQGCRDHLRDGRPGIPGYCRNGDTIRRLSEVAPYSD